LAPWNFDYALLHSAIILAPNYRLLPEATGLDILSDMNDFFDWIYSDLQALFSKSVSGVEIDTEKLLVYGDSAGASLRISGTRNINMRH
jgi:acetyl esterase/lipase